MEEVRQRDLPIDAALLSGAVIELNISRRSVGLYPPEHPIVRESIERAHGYLQKLFELRPQITLGIAKDSLIIDEYVLDKKNPVFREFALGLHTRGISSLTFQSGLEQSDLVILHQAITMYEGPTGALLVEHTRQQGLRRIRLEAVDLSHFTFREGERKQGIPEQRLWEDYVYGLLEGKLSDDESDGVIRTIEPLQMASILNERMEEGLSDEAYERVIVSYLRSKDRTRAVDKFRTFAENLNPELKTRFMKKVSHMEPSERGEMERLLSGFDPDDLLKIVESLRDKASAIPSSMVDILHKLSRTKPAQGLLSAPPGEALIIDDLALRGKGQTSMHLDGPQTIADEGYQRDLQRIVKGVETRKGPLTETIREETSEAVIDREFCDLIFGLLEAGPVRSDVQAKLLEQLTALAEAFLQTGRFLELSTLHDFLGVQSTKGKFTGEALSVLDHSFRSPSSITGIIDALKLWGRYNREGAVRLTLTLHPYLLTPLFDAVCEPSDPAVRKFFLYLLTALGNIALPEAVKRLQDNRWYVVRNMIYLIRECGGKEYVGKVRPFGKDKNKRISMEAVKTLIHFRTPDALSYLRLYLGSNDIEMRRFAVMLSGSYKVQEVVPLLIELLEKRDILETDSTYKIAAARALAQIGDRRAIESFTRLYTARLSVFQAVMNDLRIEIFRNLGAFTPDAAKPLAELGLTSKNADVRALCNKYLSNLRTAGENSDV